MKVVDRDIFSNLKLLLSSHSEIQEYIFKKWNEFQFGEFAKYNFNETDKQKKQLKFLYPYQFLVSSPFNLPGIYPAIEIIHHLFNNRASLNLVIYGDRDADGICSSSILYLFLRDKMAIPAENMHVMVPEVEDKYGITEEVAERICERKPDILITLDNGSSNKETFKAIKTILPAIKTIIIDHHTLPQNTDDYPDVNAFINPAMFPLENPLRNMCTSGLAYLFVYAITYSFTSEYNKTVLLRGKKDYFVRNGVSCEESTYDRVFYLKDYSEVISDKNFDFHELWTRECQNNFRLSKINEFLEKNPEALTDIEKFYIFQTVKMPKIFYKVQTYLPFSAIGTVADSMLLSDENRILVSEGLSILNNDKSSLGYGLKEIIKILQLFNSKISEQDLAFSVCPLVNAAGRMGQASLALHTFISGESLDCAKNAYLLKEENEKRKELSHHSLTILENTIKDSDDQRIVIGYHEEIHRGISGLIASKLAEKFEKPAMVLVHDGAYLRGSIRSYQNENVLAIIQELAHWFVQYGGHIQAAGFSLEHDKREEFIKHVLLKSRELLENKDEAPAMDDQFPVIAMQDSRLEPSIWKDLLFFAPYGPGNPRPRILLTPSGSITYKLMGKNKNHAKLSFSSIKYQSIDVVWFNFTKDIEKLERDSTIRILAEPQVNYFRGTEKQQLRVIQVQDAEPAV